MSNIEQTFTPGPWHISESVNEDTGLLIKPIPGQVIAEMDPTPNAEANARLVAAAPELLAVLENLGEAISEGCPETIANIWCYQAQTIICKATGDGQT